jgi:hypothetical protein
MCAAISVIIKAGRNVEVSGTGNQVSSHQPATKTKKISLARKKEKVLHGYYGYSED